VAQKLFSLGVQWATGRAPMMEAEWLAATELTPMLDFLRACLESRLSVTAAVV